MKPIYNYPANHSFISAFEAENKELEEVLTFIKDMIEIDINTKIYKSEYPPSELWRNWSEQQKVSISVGSNIIMLNSGHSFNNSEVKQTLPKNNFNINYFSF